MTIISGLRTADIRFPTSTQLDGSDAMNPDPDYSAAYVVVQCDDGSEGYGFTFTTGPGNDVQLAATTALAPLVVGRPVDTLVEDLGGIGRVLTHEPHLRWLGPEKGIVHMAIGAVLNALWDLAARRAGKPVWRLLAELSPEALVDLVDFRYLTDALTPAEATDLLRAAQPGRAERTAHLLAHGFPAYATTPGWLGYPDDKLVRLTREAIADGFPLVKLKVGADVDDDIRRLGLAREAVGPDVLLAVDANQRWDTADAVAWMRRLAPFDPYWIEEPTSPDDILAHRAIRQQLAPVRVASGEHIHNRVMVKQFLQAGALDVLQLDAARVGGVNENV
ncbi:MAG: fuconate dehydratase, partial [Streptosporangiales bacterium]|nr:fuconate dehydratase [Streptosporangiales bacterium]